MHEQWNDVRHNDTFINAYTVKMYVCVCVFRKLFKRPSYPDSATSVDMMVFMQSWPINMKAYAQIAPLRLLCLVLYAYARLIASCTPTFMQSIW